MPGKTGGAGTNIVRPSGHWVVNATTLALAAVALATLFLTPYEKIFDTTEVRGRDVLLGLVAFFVSTLLHSAYQLDENASIADGSFSEWRYMSRQKTEKAALLLCWGTGVLNLLAVMTALSRKIGESL